MEKFKIVYFNEIDSTNAYAMKNIADLPDKTVVSAKIQTGGYGRFKRVWNSQKADNLYISIVLKPSQKFDSSLPLANLTQYLSVILCETLEKYDVEAEIKWPNDVLVSGKKIAGILSEASLRGDSLNGVVLGVGINLNRSKSDMSKIDQPATALNLETSLSVDKDKFLNSLLASFFEGYEEFLKSGFEFIKSRYISRCSFIGRDILVKNRDSTRNGRAKAINDDGSLLLENKNEQFTVIIGDIIC